MARIKLEKYIYKTIGKPCKMPYTVVMTINKKNFCKSFTHLIEAKEYKDSLLDIRRKQE